MKLYINLIQKFYNSGDEHYERAASDIIFVVEETPHPIFSREGRHLRTTIKLTLQEALLGFEKVITHLDGHKVHIKRETVTQPGEIEKISKQGMPLHEHSSDFGDLYVDYKVNFEDKYSEEQNKCFV